MEVFPEVVQDLGPNFGLLHVRGGVSLSGAATATLDLSSPRPWRCFWSQAFPPVGVKVFSTSVEVFLERSQLPPSMRGLLHVRGGVSLSYEKSERPSFWRLLHVRGGVSLRTASVTEGVWSSPRPWRCFQNSPKNSETFSVFSTSVEVFLSPNSTSSMALSLLHVRGGVSPIARVE